MMKYSFKYISNCNMCGADSSEFVVMGTRMNFSNGMFPGKKMGIGTTVVKCEKCCLIFANPNPIPDKIEDHYSMDPADYWNDKELKPNIDAYQKIINTFHRLKKDIVPNGKYRAIDIGAGIGNFMVYLEKVDLEAFGIEPSPTFAEMAIKKNGVNPERLEIKTIENAKFQEGSFDFVNMAAVLEHFEDPNQAIKKSIHWLKPGGLIYIEVPNSKWFVSKLLNFYFRILGTSMVTNLSPMHPPFHLYEFSKRSFEKNRDNSNNSYTIPYFKIHTGSTTLPKVLDPILKPFMKMTNTGTVLEIWLQKK